MRNWRRFALAALTVWLFIVHALAFAGTCILWDNWHRPYALPEIGLIVTAAAIVFGPTALLCWALWGSIFGPEGKRLE